MLAQITPPVLDELNVKEVATLEAEEDVLDFQVRLNPAVAGSRYGAEMPAIDGQLRSGDATAAALRVRAGLTVAVGDHTVQPDEVTVTSSDRDGYATASDGGYTVAVVTEVTDELRDEGTARELVHRLQNMRRSAGFDIADRIVTWYDGDGEASTGH